MLLSIFEQEEQSAIGAADVPFGIGVFVDLFAGGAREDRITAEAIDKGCEFSRVFFGSSPGEQDPVLEGVAGRDSFPAGGLGSGAAL